MPQTKVPTTTLPGMGVPTTRCSRDQLCPPPDCPPGTITTLTSGTCCDYICFTVHEGKCNHKLSDLTDHAAKCELLYFPERVQERGSTKLYNFTKTLVSRRLEHGCRLLGESCHSLSTTHLFQRCRDGYI